MNVNEIVLGKSYLCKGSEFNEEFVGIIEKKLENSAIVEIIGTASVDDLLMKEKSGRTVVSYHNMKIMSQE